MKESPMQVVCRMRAYRTALVKRNEQKRFLRWNLICGAAAVLITALFVSIRLAA